MCFTHHYLNCRESRFLPKKKKQNKEGKNQHLTPDLCSHRKECSQTSSRANNWVSIGLKKRGRAEGADEVRAFSKQQMMSSHCGLQISHGRLAVPAVIDPSGSVVWMCGLWKLALIRGANTVICSIDCEVKTVCFLAWAFIISFTSSLIIVGLPTILSVCGCAWVCWSIFRCSPQVCCCCLKASLCLALLVDLHLSFLPRLLQPLSFFAPPSGHTPSTYTEKEADLDFSRFFLQILQKRCLRY